MSEFEQAIRTLEANISGRGLDIWRLRDAETLVLKALRDYEAALEFYANEKHWKDQGPYVSTPVIFIPEDATGWGPQGNKARETLEKWKAKR